MRKNFMLSLAAMAALPMAGLADTTWPVSLKPATDWTTEGTTTINPSSTPEKIIALGKSISYTVTLPQGKYKLLSGERTNANFVVTWDTYSFTNEAEVDINLAKETKVTLTLSAASFGENFSIKDLYLKLEFGFNSAKNDDLKPRLGSYTYKNDIYTYRGGVFAKIEALPDKIEGTTVNFAEFKKTLLADGRALFDVIEKFEDVDFTDPSLTPEEKAEAKAEAKAKGKAAFELYCQQQLWKYKDAQNPTDLEKNLAKLERVIALYKDLKDMKADIQSAWSRIDADKSESGEYTKNVYQPVVAKFVADLNAELGQMEANYADAANKLPSEADIKKKYGDKDGGKYYDLTKSFEWYKGVKGAFIAAEAAYTKELTAIRKAKSDIDKDPATLAPEGITDKLKAKAEASLNKLYEPVAEDLTAFTSIIVDANAADPYKALVEFHKNEAYKYDAVKKCFDVAGGDLETAKTSMGKVADKYFKNDNTGYYGQLNVEFQKVYGNANPDLTLVQRFGLVQRFEKVKADNALYKDKYGKYIEGITDAKLTAISDSIAYINTSFQYVVSDIKAGSEPAPLTPIKYYEITFDEKTGYTLKGEFELKDVEAKIKALEDAVSAKGNKGWIEACNDLNGRLDVLTESLDDFKKILTKTVDIANYDQNTVGLSLTVDDKLVYDAYAHWKDYAYAEEGGEKPSLTAQIAALKNKIKAYSANELYKGESESANSAEYKATDDAVKDLKTLVDDFVTDGHSDGGYVDVQRATRIYGIYGGKLNNWTAAYAEKNEIVTDKNIYKDADPGHRTYGDLLNEFQTAISTLQMEINLAMAKNGEDHYKALSELNSKYSRYDYSPAISACEKSEYPILEVTRDSYKKDKVKYALQVRYEDVNAQISWCQNEAKALKDSLDILKKDLTDNSKDYGNRLEELKGAANSTDTATFNGIMNAFKGITYVKVDDDDVYTLAHLVYDNINTPTTSTFEEADAKYEIVKVDFEEIFKLAQALKALNKKAEAVKKAFALNETLNTYYTKWYNDGTYKDAEDKNVNVFEGFTGGFNAYAAAILATSIDSDRKVEMAGEVTKINTAVDNFKKELEKHYKAETIADNASTIEGDLTALAKQVNDFKDAVVASNNNYNAYVYLKNKWNNALWVDVKDENGKEKRISYAENVANGIAASVPNDIASASTAHGVFYDKAKDYEGDLNDGADKYTVYGVSKYIDKAYAEGKASTEQAVNEAKIKGLIETIDKVADDCNDNDSNYKDLCSLYTTATNEKGLANQLADSEIKTAWLAELKPYLDQIDKAKKGNEALKDTYKPELKRESRGFDSYYKAGEFVDPKGADYVYFCNKVNDAKTKMSSINTKYLEKYQDKGGYVEIVKTSNDNLHRDFLAQHAAAVDRFNEIIASLQNYIANGYDTKTVEGAIDALYGKDYKAKLDKVKSDEADVYWMSVEQNNDLKTPEKVLDIKKQHQELATVSKNIEDKFIATVKEFNKAAIKDFKEAFNEAYGEVTKVLTLVYEGNKYVVTGAADKTAANDYKDLKVVAKAYSAVIDRLTKAKNEVYNGTDLIDGNLIFNLNDYRAKLAEIYTGSESLLAQAELQLPASQIAVWTANLSEMDAAIQSLFDEYEELAAGEIDDINYEKNFNEASAAFKEAVAAIGTPTADNIDGVRTRYEAAAGVYDAFSTMIGDKDKSDYMYDQFLAYVKNKYKYTFDSAKTTISENIKNAETFITTEDGEVYVGTKSITDCKAKLLKFEKEVELNRQTYKFHTKYADKKLAELATELNTAVDNSEKLKGDTYQVNIDEKAFLNIQLTELKAYLVTNEFTEAETKDYTSSINGIYSDLTDSKNEAWKTPVGTRNALIKIQKDIRDLRASMTNFVAEDVMAELVQMAKTNGETYERASANLEQLFDFQKKAITKPADSSEQLQTAVENDKNLVFTAEDHKAEIEKAANTMKNYDLTVQAALNKKTTHENICDEIVGRFESNGTYANMLAELQAKMEGFDETVQEMFSWFIPYYEANAADCAKHYAGVKVGAKNNNDLLDATELDKIFFNKDPKSVNASVRSPQPDNVTEESPFVSEDVKTFDAFFAYVDKVCSMAEVNVRVKELGKTGSYLKYGMDGLIWNGTIDRNKANYIVNYDELDKAIKAQYKLINAAYTVLYGAGLGEGKTVIPAYPKGYIDEAYYGGWLSHDINGKKYLDENGDEAPLEVDFVADCLQNIFDKIDELNATIDKVVADTEANIYYRGDIDHDKVVDVNDFASLKLHILGYAEHQLEGMKLLAADTNADGKVNIGDLTRMVTMILDNEGYAAPAREAANTGINDALAVMTEGEGVHQRIGIMLDAERVYAGCQMDILLPEGVTLISESLGEMADGLSLSSNDLENGYHRVVLSSFDGAAMNTGNGAMLWLDVEVGHNYNGEGIELSNILFSNAAGRTFELSVASGETTGLSNVSMTQEVKEKIYNVGGILMDSLKRGVNIIRGNDGSSKKIVK